MERSKVRLEGADGLLKMSHVFFADHEALPDTHCLACCMYRVNRPESSIVATYEQEHVDGTASYLPFFESGSKGGPEKEFTVSFVPLEGLELSLESKHKKRTVALKTRVTVHPQHEELIRVKASAP